MNTITHLKALGRMFSRLGVDHSFEIHPDHLRIYIRGNGKQGFVVYAIPPESDPILWHIEKDVCRTLDLEPSP